MAAFPAFFDTCSLYGGILNDLFLRLAEEGAYRVLWSEQVLLELRRNLAERVGDEPASRRVEAMRRSFPDAAVDGYQHLEKRMPVDAGDRHVAAAAVHAGAEVIVTANLRHFPAEALSALQSSRGTRTTSCWTSSISIPTSSPAASTTSQTATSTRR